MTDFEALEVARTTFEVFNSYTEIDKKLNALKEKLREYAAGSKKEIIVEGVGKINVSSPSAGSSSSVLTINEDLLSKSSELKKKLLEKGIIYEKNKVRSPSAASVTITPNV